MGVTYKNVRVLLAGALIVGVMVTACGPGIPPATTTPSIAPATTVPVGPTKAAGPKKGGTLTVAIIEDPRALDGLKDAGTEGDYVLEQITEGLVRYTDQGEIVPQLAEALPETPNDKTYIFKIRKGVKFHDGTELDADAVKWSLDMALDKDSGSYGWAWLAQYVDSIQVVDKYTVQVNLKRTWPDFLAVIGAQDFTYMRSKAAFAKYGQDYGTKAVIGTGPFKFVEWVKGDHITLERNPDYWNPKGVPYVDKLIFKPIPEASTRLMSFQAGQVDVLYSVPYKDVAGLKSKPGMTVTTSPGATIFELMVNTKDPVLKDKRVRQALSLAIDRKVMSEVVFAGLATVADSNFPSWHWAHNPNLGPYEYNPDKAKALLAEAGFTAAKPLRFKLTTTSVTEFIDGAVLIQSQLAKIGVDVKVELIEKSRLGTLFGDPSLWSVLLYRLILGVPSADYAWRTHSSKSDLDLPYYNMEGAFQNPEVEKLLDEADSTVNKNEALKLFTQISVLLREDLPYVPLAWLPTVTAQANYVKDLPRFVPYYVFPLNGVWLDK